MNLLYKTISTDEPVLLEQAKVHLGVVDTYHDELISNLIGAARERAETFTNRSLVEKTVILMLDTVPSSVKLPRGPIKTMTSVKYWNGTTMVTLATSRYEADTSCDPGILTFKDGISEYVEKVNGIHIEYTVGWGNREISGVTVTTPFPRPIYNAMLMMIRTMFDMREDMVKGTIVARVPQNAEYILSPYRVFEFL